MEFPIRIEKNLASLKRITSPKKVLGIITACLTLLTFARAVVCLVESYSAVRSERHADAGLIKVCEDGLASLSNDFRKLCILKRAERASPVLLKAILRAVTSSFSDFCEIFSSPSRVALLVLFSITGMAAPIVRAVVALFIQNLQSRRLRNERGRYATSDDENDDDDDDDTNFQVVQITPRRHERGGARQRFGTTLRRSLRQISCSEPEVNFQMI